MLLLYFLKQQVFMAQKSCSGIRQLKNSPILQNNIISYAIILHQHHLQIIIHPSLDYVSIANFKTEHALFLSFLEVQSPGATPQKKCPFLLIFGDSSAQGAASPAHVQLLLFYFHWTFML